jgi:hypothetical protein
MLINSTLKCGGKEVPPKLRSGRVIRVLRYLSKIFWTDEEETR